MPAGTRHCGELQEERGRLSNPVQRRLSQAETEQVIRLYGRRRLGRRARRSVRGAQNHRPPPPRPRRRCSAEVRAQDDRRVCRPRRGTVRARGVAGECGRRVRRTRTDPGEGVPPSRRTGTATAWMAPLTHPCRVRCDQHRPATCETPRWPVKTEPALGAPHRVDGPVG